MASGSLCTFRCQHKYSYATPEQKKFMRALLEEFRKANEWRDTHVECFGCLCFSDTVEPTIVDKGGGNSFIKSLLTWNAFMWCNVPFISGKYGCR